jgi:hypothetical protein
MRSVVVWTVSVLMLLGVSAVSNPGVRGTAAAATGGEASGTTSSKPGPRGGFHAGTAPAHAHLTRTATPPKLTPAQQHLQNLARNHWRGGPYTAGTLKGAREVRVAPSVGGTPTNTARSSRIPSAPNDFRAFRATGLVYPTLPLYATAADVDEPSVSNLGNVVFYTGNKYAVESTDSGHSFTYISPFSFFTAPGGFCCDQVTISESTQSLTAWELQGCQVLGGPDVCNSGDNTVRLAFTNSLANLAADNWYWWDFTAQTFGFPEGYHLDYSHLALGANSLYWTVNVWDNTTNCNGGSCFATAIIVRFTLSLLAAQNDTYNFAYYSPTQDGVWTPTDTRGGTTEYWASVANCGIFCDQKIDVYRWPEGTDFHGVSYSEFDSFNGPLNGFTYMNGGGYCPAADGGNWCARDDSRVKTGWQSGNTIGFQWDAQQDGNFPYPYVDQATFDVSSGWPSFSANYQIWNPNYAWMYPGAGIDARGHLGISLAIGGGTWQTYGYPGSQFAIADDVSGGAYEYHYLDNGSHSAAEWGDYLTARPATGEGSIGGNTWLATGYVEADGPYGIYTKPSFYWLGRERDDPFAPGAGAYNNFFNEGTSQYANTGFVYARSNCTCDYAVYNNWGDGVSDPATNLTPAPGFPLYYYTYGTHAYAEEGSYGTTVSAYDNFNSSAVSSTATATVSDAGLSASGTSINTHEGATFKGVVATFSDADAYCSIADYSATIAWGDGAITNGAIAWTGSGCTYRVSGSHRYAEEGSRAISVQIKDVGGSTSTTTGTAKVSDAKLTSTGTTIAGTEAVRLTTTVANFKDADPAGVSTDYAATINWGDNTSSSGVISAVTGGFTVTGTHTYVEGKTYTVKTTIKDHGASTVATSTANIADPPPIALRSFF